MLQRKSPLVCGQPILNSDKIGECHSKQWINDLTVQKIQHPPREPISTNE